jgi:hypothetical protein
MSALTRPTLGTPSRIKAAIFIFGSLEGMLEGCGQGKYGDTGIPV